MNESKLRQANELKDEITRLEKVLRYFDMKENDVTHEVDDPKGKYHEHLPNLIVRERVGVYVPQRRSEYDRVVFNLFEHISDEQFRLIIETTKRSIQDKLTLVKTKYEAL